MARKLRLQFTGAMYHVINRGNYRRDIFGSVGAAKAFETVLAEACDEFCRGWAIGTAGWRRAIAEDHAHLALSPGVPAQELRDFKHVKWESVLQRLLNEAGKTLEAAATDSKGAVWKHELAERLRRDAAAPHAWIAERLQMGSPNSVRSYLSRRRALNRSNQQLSA